MLPTLQSLLRFIDAYYFRAFSAPVSWTLTQGVALGYCIPRRWRSDAECQSLIARGCLAPSLMSPSDEVSTTTR